MEAEWLKEQESNASFPHINGRATPSGKRPKMTNLACNVYLIDEPGNIRQGDSINDECGNAIPKQKKHVHTNLFQARTTKMTKNADGKYSHVCKLNDCYVVH